MPGFEARDRRASAARKRPCEDTNGIFPPPDGGLLPRAEDTNCTNLREWESIRMMGAIRVSNICVHPRPSAVNGF